MQKLKSIRLCLSAHPDHEVGSEFADRISDLDELIKAQEYADAALIDDFAKAAMQGLVANTSCDAERAISKGMADTYAKDAYTLAEALMKERERRMKG